MSDSVHKKVFGPSLVVLVVIGVIWTVFTVLTLTYGDWNEPLQNVGRVVMMAGVGLMAGGVIAQRLASAKKTPKGAEGSRNP